MSSLSSILLLVCLLLATTVATPSDDNNDNDTILGLSIAAVVIVAFIALCLIGGFIWFITRGGATEVEESRKKSSRKFDH